MHGDIMKKVIKVKYRNIFKYEDHQEVIKFDEKGYLEESENHKVISFMTDKLIRIASSSLFIIYKVTNILKAINNQRKVLESMKRKCINDAIQII